VRGLLPTTQMIKSGGQKGGWSLTSFGILMGNTCGRNTGEKVEDDRKAPFSRHN